LVYRLIRLNRLSLKLSLSLGLKLLSLRLKNAVELSLWTTSIINV
jgi:hypothetical protein